jgi:hypothetical protein
MGDNALPHKLNRERLTAEFKENGSTVLDLVPEAVKAHSADWSAGLPSEFPAGGFEASVTSDPLSDMWCGVATVQKSR